MTTVEIHKRVLGRKELFETLHVPDMRAFRRHWTARFQGKPDYTFRFPGATPSPVGLRVYREPEGASTAEPAMLDLTDELIAKIASFNGDMTPAQVHYALMAGKTIYTTFSRYRLE